MPDAKTKPTATALQDADPAPWNAERQPDLDPALLRLCGAHDRLKAAQEAIHAHEPPYSGEAWAAKTADYATAKAALDAEFKRIKGSGT